MPLQGWPLIDLFSLWLAGRIVMYLGSIASAEVIAVIDTSFLFVLLGVLLREIVAGRNWRNLPITFVLALFATANIFSHFEALGYVETDGMSYRMAIAVVITVGALMAWIVLSDHAWTAIALICAGIVNVLRLCRWQGLLALSEPLVWSLHLGYLWLPIGLMLIGVSYFVKTIPASAGIHALTAGAIASMILAVMTRATLGHSGRGLTADKVMGVIYILIFVAALTRVLASLTTLHYHTLLITSSVTWCGAFGLFCVHYGQMMFSR